MRCFLVIAICTLAALLNQGCGSSKTVPAVPEVSVAPEVLRVPKVPVGGSSRAYFALENVGRGASQLELVRQPNAPFAMTWPGGVLEGGQSMHVEVTFSPSEEGEHRDYVKLRIDGVAREVLLSGLAIAACEADAPCVQPRWDGDRCRTTPVEDGTACEEACIEAGVCMGGICKGALRTCDDGNDCTTDFCIAEGGCGSAEVTCANSDPCKVAQCVPGQGCVTSAVQDGTACGDASCAQTQICVGGECTTRATPEGARCDYSPCQEGTCSGTLCVPSGPARTLSFQQLGTVADAGEAEDILVDGDVITVLNQNSKPVRLASGHLTRLPVEARQCLSSAGRLSCVGFTRGSRADGLPLLFENAVVQIAKTGAEAWRLSLDELPHPPWDPSIWRAVRVRLASLKKGGDDLLVAIELMPRADDGSSCRILATLVLDPAGNVKSASRVALPAGLDECQHPHLNSVVTTGEGRLSILNLGSANYLDDYEVDPVRHNTLAGAYSGQLVAIGADAGIVWSGAFPLSGSDLAVDDGIITGSGKPFAFSSIDGSILYSPGENDDWDFSGLNALVARGDVVGPPGKYDTDTRRRISRKTRDGSYVWTNGSRRCRNGGRLSCAQWRTPNGKESLVVLTRETSTSDGLYSCIGTEYLTAIGFDDGAEAWACPLQGRMILEMHGGSIYGAYGGGGGAGGPLTIGRFMMPTLRPEVGDWCSFGGGASREWAN